MSANLLLTVRFLAPWPVFHGRGDGGEPEWPPSPLRLFQALVASAAGRWPERQFTEYAGPALDWFAGVGPPEIVAPGAVLGSPLRTAVPNNDLDVVASAWAKRQEPKKQPNELKTMKTVRPHHLASNGTGDELPAVHYLFPLADEDRGAADRHLGTLQAAARAVTHLGWGVDQVAGTAAVVTDDEAARLTGLRWRPVTTGGTPLRVPTPGTLADLVRKHGDFLDRLRDGFRPVPPLTAFAVVGYDCPEARPTGGAGRPFAAFQLLDPGGEQMRSYHPVRRFAAVAGMARHAAAGAARRAGWDEARVNSFLLGHGDHKGGQATTDDRLLFLPLPSINRVGVQGVRRLLVAGPPGADLGPVRRLLNGAELTPEGADAADALLALVPATDNVVRRFVEPSRAWATVTPVMLPGYDDPGGVRKRLSEKDPARAMTAGEKKSKLEALDKGIRDLLQRAFDHAGVPGELSRAAAVEYREVGFLRGTEPSRNYDLPPLKFPRYHVRIVFPHPVRGPLAVGAGRYRGLGLFAAD